MLQIVLFVRYSNASIHYDSLILLGAIIFFLLCGILIFQNKIWEEEYYEKNKKWLDWKTFAIKANKADLSRVYSAFKNNISK